MGVGYCLVVDELEGGLVFGCDRLDGIYIYAHLNITKYTIPRTSIRQPHLL